MKLSIIIPIYNVEKYIEKCVKSCLNQQGVTLDIDYEIICVNDGSPDKSASIAKKISQHYDGLRILDQENQGLSGARNTGLEYARGEYVWFVDSDDYITENCLSGLLPHLDGTIDMLNIQCNYVFENGDPIKKREIYPIEANSDGISLLFQGRYPTMAQLTIYRTSFLKSNMLSFYKGILHEDTEFTPRALFFAKKVVSFPHYIYNYLQRTSDSITASYKVKNAKDAIKVCDSLYSFSRNIKKDMQPVFAERISQILFTHLYRFRLLSENEKNLILEEMANKRYIYRAMLGGVSLKCKVAGMILLISPRITYYLLRVALFK